MYCIVKKRAVLKRNLIPDRFALERKLPKRYRRTLKSGQRKPNLDESKTSFVSPNKHTEMYLLSRMEVLEREKKKAIVIPTFKAACFI